MALLKETIQLVCVSQDSRQRNSILWEDGKVGSNHSQILQEHLASRKKTGEEGSIAGDHAKMRTSGASSVGSKI